MLLQTARFGSLEVAVRDLLVFPAGLIGFEDLRAWTLFSEFPLAWLQSVEDPQIALPLAYPFSYVPDYQLRLGSSDCSELQLSSEVRPLVLSVAVKHSLEWTLNLRAPVVIHLAARLGRQVITPDEQPLRHVLPRALHTVRKSA